MYYDVFSVADYETGEPAGVMIRPNVDLSAVYEVGQDPAYCGCVFVDGQPPLVALDPIVD